MKPCVYSSKRELPKPKLLEIPVTGGNAINCILQEPKQGSNYPVLFCKGFVWDAGMEASDVTSRHGSKLSDIERILVKEYGLAIASVSPASYPGYNGLLTLEAYLKDVAIIADWLGAEVAMGHSFGGYVVGRLALRRQFRAITSLCAPFSLKEALKKLDPIYTRHPEFYAKVLLGMINTNLNLTYQGIVAGAARCVSALPKRGLTHRLGHVNAESYARKMVGSVIDAPALDALANNGSGAGFENTRVLVIYGKADPLVIGRGAGLSPARTDQDAKLFEQRWRAIAPDSQIIGLPVGHNLNARGSGKHEKQDYTRQIAALIGNHLTVPP